MVLLRSRPARTHLWRLQLATGLVAATAYAVLGHEQALSGTGIQLLYLAVGFFGLGSVLLGLRLHRPESPAPWLLLAAAMTAYVLGDVLYLRLSQSSPDGPPFPSVADAAYYAFFPLMAAAVLETLRRRLPGRDRAGVVDAALITVAAAGLSWTYLMAPYARDHQLDALTKVALLGYPIGDLLLVTLLARLLLSPGRRPATLHLLVVGLLATLVADASFGVQELAGTYRAGDLVDVGWLVMYVLWGTAALHPSMSSLTVRVPLEPRRPSGRRMATMAAAAVTGPLLLVWSATEDRSEDIVVLAVVCVVMFGLVLVRVVMLLDELERQRDRLTQALQELEQAQADRRALLHRTVEAAENERMRMAADLHDGPIQRLATVSLVLDRTGMRLGRGDAAGAAELLERAQQELAAEMDDLRGVMRALRPPVLDEIGLAAGIDELVADFVRRTGASAAADVRLSAALPGASETVLYRVVQEALSNVAKHAGAGSVAIRLEELPDRVEVTVADDGRGFLPSAAATLLADGHFGLTGMRERLQAVGGSLHVESAPGRGTRLVASLARSPERVPQAGPLDRRDAVAAR